MFDILVEIESPSIKCCYHFQTWVTTLGDSESFCHGWVDVTPASLDDMTRNQEINFVCNWSLLLFFWIFWKLCKLHFDVFLMNFKSLFKVFRRIVKKYWDQKVKLNGSSEGIHLQSWTTFRTILYSVCFIIGNWLHTCWRDGERRSDQTHGEWCCKPS